MSLQWNLSRLFQQEESGAGEAAAGGGATDNDAPDSSAIETGNDVRESPAPDHVANVDFVKEWAKTADAGKVSATVTTTETNNGTAVVETTTDAVSDDDAVTSSGKEQDQFLLDLAESFDFTREELKGISNEGLASLIARERRRSGGAGSETTTDNTTAETTATTTAAGGTAETATTAQSVSFEDYAQAVRESMAEQGHDETAIERQVSIERLKWDRDEALLNDARVAREETQWVRQQFDEERRQQFAQAETQGFLDIAKATALEEKGLLPKPDGKPGTPEQVENLNKWFHAFNQVKQVNPDVQKLARTNLPAARKMAANIAFTITFPEVVSKRGQRAYANKMLSQADRVMGSARSARVPETGSPNGNYADTPAISRHWAKMQTNKT